MKLETFMRALVVADTRGFGGFVEPGVLLIPHAYGAVESFWLWLDAPWPPPFESEGELREALKIYDHDDDGSIAYIDTAEVDYILKLPVFADAR